MNRSLPLLGFAALIMNAASGNWNQFRGPNGDGDAGAADLPTEFSDTKNVRWRTAIHDEGHSSPVISGNQIWLTSGRADNSELFAICVDLESGTIVHDRKVFEFPAPKLAYPNLNGPASPTPVIDEGRVYVHFGTFGTACLDTKTGEKLWERTDLHCDHRVRAASSPIIDGDLLYLTFDGVDAQFLVALNKHDGETRWRRDRSVGRDLAKVLDEQGIDPEETLKEKPGDNRKSYATPTVIAHAGRRQVVSPAAEATYGYDAKSGEELWHVRHPGMGWNVTCRPIYRDGLVYFNTGISKRLFAVDPSGSGDVTETHLKWVARKSVPNISSYVFVDDLVFMVTDQGGVASCRDAKTGNEIWRERLGSGRNYWASPIAANGKVFFFSKEGDVAVVAAGRKFDLLARNRIAGAITASPAVAGDAMILRSATHLYHIAEGFETAPQEKKPVVAQEGVNGEEPTSDLLSVAGYYVGGKTNEDGKFEATFLIESKGEDKDNWPTVTFTGNQFRDACAKLKQYHYVTIDLAEGKVRKRK